MAVRNTVNREKFNPKAVFPYELRYEDFALAMQDIYDFFYDVNELLISKGLTRFDDMLRPANMSGMVSDMLTASLAKHSRTLTQNASQRTSRSGPEWCLSAQFDQSRDRRNRNKEYSQKGRRG